VELVAMSMARARAEANLITNDRLYLLQGGRGGTVMKRTPSIDGGNTSGKMMLRRNESMDQTIYDFRGAGRLETILTTCIFYFVANVLLVIIRNLFKYFAA
jgi:hypothetical protein